MELYLYKFAKDFNSTKRPTDSDSKILVNGQPRENMDVLRPSFLLLNTLTFEDFPAHRYNYAYIPQFDRYYYMTGAVWVRNAGWQCTFEVDTLASYKTEIGNSSQYVLRAASDFDGGILDTIYPSQASSIVNSEKIQTNFKSNLSDGVYIVGISNGSDVTHGGISYYVFTESQFKAFLSNVFSNLNWWGEFTESGELSEDIVKTIFNPMQYIVSCMWFPFSVDDVSTSQTVSTVKMGYWNITANGRALGARPVYTDNFTVSLPKHPQQSRGKYLNSTPYTEYLLDFRPWGQISLNASQVVDYSELELYIIVDYITGTGILNIAVDNATKSIRTVYSQFGVTIKLSQVVFDAAGMVSSVLSAGGGALTGLLAGNPASTVSASISGIGDAISCAMPQVETIGGQGSFSDFVIQPYLVTTFHTLVGEDNEHNGRPLCERRKISTLSGFIMCQNAEVPIRATVEEQETIRSKLETGFYYE